MVHYLNILFTKFQWDETEKEQIILLSHFFHVKWHLGGHQILLRQKSVRWPWIKRSYSWCGATWTQAGGWSTPTGSDVLLETLIIFLLIFLKAHLLFGYPGIWLLLLFLELCLCVKQVAGLPCKPARGDWSWPGLIYQWLKCSASKLVKSIVVTTDFAKEIAPGLDCLHDRRSGADGKEWQTSRGR